MPVIEVSGLRKQYGSTVAVEDVSFTVEAGEIFGILGPNGAGKTTTLEILEGLRQADGGEVTVLGQPPWPAGDTASGGYDGPAVTKLASCWDWARRLGSCTYIM